MRRILVFLGIWLWFNKMVEAQSNRDITGLGSWNIFNMRYDVNKTWSGFIEGQVRSLGFYSRFHYNELKGGVSYRMGFVGVAAGFGTYNTYTEGGNFRRPIVREELRNWQQFILAQPEGWLKVEQRYRAEQRFTNVGFRNRFRYRIAVQRKVWNDVTLVTWNEIFLTDRPTYFERNRFFLGMGFPINQWSNLQCGWVRQFDYNLVDEIGKNFFQVSYSMTFTRGQSLPIGSND